MLKNVSLIQSRQSGKQSWRLLDSGGCPIRAFDLFAKALARDSVNTRANYCRWLAEFFDYLIEASAWTPAGQNGDVRRDDLVEVIESYDEYLVFGQDSGNEIARRISKTLPSPRISRSSSSTKHAAVRKFLKLSERFRAQMLELNEAGALPNKPEDGKQLFNFGSMREPSQFQRQALVANSMISGVISGGIKLIEEGILPTSVPDISYDHNRAFPFDRVKDVLSQMTCYRDKALYAFCAASGCRISEALQLLWEDIDILEQKVRLIDPKSRPYSPSYLALQPVERDRLVWKGRATSLALLIEPFATMFFDALAAYLRHEYVPHGRHKFVFQYENEGQAGCPYYLAQASSRYEVLKRAKRLAGISGVKGPHAFRHMYGTYLLNYFPRPDGSYGLPLGLVQKLMGHKQIKDTAKYARHDKDLLEAELRYANFFMYEGGRVRSVNEVKRNALLAKLRSVEQQMSDESMSIGR